MVRLSRFGLPLVWLAVLGSPALAQQPPAAVTLRLEIHNGPQADRYRARSVTPRCQVRGGEPDTLVAAFRPNYPSAVTWFALTVLDPYDATRGTKAFRFELTVASIQLGSVRYTVEGRPDRSPLGSGAVTLAFQEDGRISGQFSVRTDGGIGISGTVACLGRP